MQGHTLSWFHFICSILFIGGTGALQNVTVGVVLDFDSSVGKVAKAALQLAADDVNKDTNLLNATRFILDTRDLAHEDAIAGASAALDLLNRGVVAIIGAQTSEITEFVAHLGDAATVPIVSFSATNPLLSMRRYPYFIRMAHSDSLQMEAIAAVIKAYGWRRIVVIYPDDDFGTGPLPWLSDALTNVGSEIEYRSAIPPSADTQTIREELYKLKTMQSRVFVAHVHSQLGSNLFIEAQKLGMVDADYVWIITDEFTTLLEVLNATTLACMQGVLGVKSYIQNSNKLDAFSGRWKKRFRLDNPDEEKAELNQYEYVSSDPRYAAELTDNLKVFREGPRLLDELINTKFTGLSGPVQLQDGEIVGSTYEIVNVIGKSYNTVGYWTHGIGLCQNFNNTESGYNSSSGCTHDPKNMGAGSTATVIKPVIWPGGLTGVPRGWVTPNTGNKMKIGVPLKDGFDQFVTVTFDSSPEEPKVTGFCIDVFETVVSDLEYPLPYEFIPYRDGLDNVTHSYDELVYQVYLKKFDAVVGDTTILANRSKYVDFTQPFTQSGLVMVVPIRADVAGNAWAFMQPFTPGMWCTTGAFFIFTGVVVWLLEHKLNPEFRGTPKSQVVTLLWFSFSTPFFSQREKIVSSLGRMVIIIWLFVVLVLTSSYTANLTSILTVQQMQPSIQDVDSLKASGFAVGYQFGSFVGDYVHEQLGISKKNLKAYSTPQQYAEALSKGPNNGGVAAIFDEIPYIRVFLSAQCGFTIVGPTYKTGGLGFVFPKGSPLVSDMSTAILALSESSKEMQGIEAKWFNNTACTKPGATVASNRLSTKSFWGLYLITGMASVIALFVFLCRLCYNFSRDPNSAQETRTASESKSISMSTRMKSFVKFADRREPMPATANSNSNGETDYINSPMNFSHSPFRATTSPAATHTTSSFHDNDESDDGDESEIAGAAENSVSGKQSWKHNQQPSQFT